MSDLVPQETIESLTQVNSKHKIIKRKYYADSIATFLEATIEEILGKLALNGDFSLEQTQRSPLCRRDF